MELSYTHSEFLTVCLNFCNASSRAKSQKRFHRNTEISFENFKPLHGKTCIAFKKSDIIGKGRFGVKVFRGIFHNQKVAVKRLDSDLVDTIWLMQETDKLKQLEHHENILQYIFTEEDDDFLYIVSGLCLLNLQDEIQKPQLNISPIVVLQKLANGLAHLHANKIVHGNLKPTNILLNYVDQVKISDFGLFKPSVLEGSSVKMGCESDGFADWFAPELLHLLKEQSNKEIEMKSSWDIFSFGCILWYAFNNGDHPFGKNSVERQYNISHNKFKGRDWVSCKKVKKLVLKMLSWDSDKRPEIYDIIHQISFIL